MILLDDLCIKVPLKISWEVLQEIKDKVDKELGYYENEEEVLQDLRRLQVSLETGELEEETYDQRESELLDILEEMREG